MEKIIEIANFMLIKDNYVGNDGDTFYGEAEIHSSLPTRLPSIVYVYGKAYDFEGNKKSFIKLKFFNDNEYYGVGGNGEYHDVHDDGDYYDLDIDYDDINRDEIGEGKIFLENSKFSPRSPDFHGKCSLKASRELDSENYIAEIEYDFEIAGWYNKKILDDSLKINLKINYNESENYDKWFQVLYDTNEMEREKIINLFASNIDFASRDIFFKDDVIKAIFFDYKLYDKILNQNLINQGYTIAKQIINQKSNYELQEKIEWEKSRKIKSDWEDIWTMDELKDIAEIEADLNPRSNNENETDELSDDELPF